MKSACAQMAAVFLGRRRHNSNFILICKVLTCIKGKSMHTFHITFFLRSPTKWPTTKCTHNLVLTIWEFVFSLCIQSVLQSVLGLVTQQRMELPCKAPARPSSTAQGSVNTRSAVLSGQEKHNMWTGGGVTVAQLPPQGFILQWR